MSSALFLLRKAFPLSKGYRKIATARTSTVAGSTTAAAYDFDEPFPFNQLMMAKRLRDEGIATNQAEIQIALLTETAAKILSITQKSFYVNADLDLRLSQMKLDFEKTLTHLRLQMSTNRSDARVEVGKCKEMVEAGKWTVLNYCMMAFGSAIAFGAFQAIKWRSENV